MLTWLDCPRQYRLRYLDVPRPAPRPQRAHTTVGTVTHNVLRDFWDLSPDDRTPQRVSDIVDAQWVPVGFRDAEQAQRWRERVRWQVLAYLRSLGEQRQGRPVGTERTVAFTSDRMAFSGRVDRLDNRDGELVVVDYKTGRRAPTEQDARSSLALALYAVGAARVFRPPCTRVELHHVPTGTVRAHQHTAESLARKVAEADSIVRDLVAAQTEYAAHGADSALFAARLSPLCAWCEVRAHCPEGSAYGPEKSDWAGLPGEDDVVPDDGPRERDRDE
ncbi:MAG: PD-(D/E)XK nuclease family protein [Austwickia sp.]|nr:PD-(D/E)XK nuclease family protein [Austwickia sp.]